MANAMNGNSFADTLHKLMGFMHALRKYKIYVIASVLVTCLLGGLYYLTATRIYKAQAVVMVMQNGGDYWETSNANAGRTDLLPTYEKLFTSDAVLKGAAESLHRNIAETPTEWLLAFLRVNIVKLPNDIRNYL